MRGDDMRCACGHTGLVHRGTNRACELASCDCSMFEPVSRAWKYNPKVKNPRENPLGVVHE